MSPDLLEKAHKCHCQLNLIPREHQQVKFRALFALAAFVGGTASPGHCTASSFGEEKTCLSLALEEPAQHLQTLHSKGEEVFICLYFMRWGFTECPGTPLNSKKWSSIEALPKDKTVLVREIFGISGQSIGLFPSRLFHSTKTVITGEIVKKGQFLTSHSNL